MLSKIIVSVLPGIVFCIIFYLIDKNKNKKRTINLIIMFLLGGIGAYITYRLEWHFGSYFPEFKDSNMWQILLYGIFGVAIFEEGFKWFCTSLSTYSNKIKDMFSVIVYSVFCSAGFAVFETLINYTSVLNLNNLIRRGFSAVPHHICFAIIMGFLIGFGKFKKKVFYIIGLIITILIHAISNWFIYKPGMFDYRIYFINYVLLLCVSIYICIYVRKKGVKI